MFNLFRKTSPEAAELARLAALTADGRGVEGVLTDVVESLAYYSYEVRGVGYHAAQDLSLLAGTEASHFLAMLGPVGVRYSTKNPANSMVMAKNWSGLRGQKLHETKPTAAKPTA